MIGLAEAHDCAGRCNLKQRCKRLLGLADPPKMSQSGSN